MELKKIDRFIFMSEIENFKLALKTLLYGDYKKINDIVSDIFVPAIKSGL